jgi:outer membrane protein assembly factor BamB
MSRYLKEKRWIAIFAAILLAIPSATNITTATFPKDTVRTSAMNATSSPWPMQNHDLNRTGRSEYDTSMNNGLEKWRYYVGGDVGGSPVIASDGTIYFGATNLTSYPRLYAMNTNGTLKWTFDMGYVGYSNPAIGPDGIIYMCMTQLPINKLLAIYPNGTLKWSFPIYGTHTPSSPAVAPDTSLVTADTHSGKYIIYIGSTDNYFYAVNSNGTMKWNFTTNGPIECSPSVGLDGTVYIGSGDAHLYAIYPNGTKKWWFYAGTDVDGGVSIGKDGTIYLFGLSKIYALYPNGKEKWNLSSLSFGGPQIPSIGPDGTIYFASEASPLYAINPNGTKKWEFPIQCSSPAIGADGTIYVGSRDDNLYAIRPNGTVKWKFTIWDDIRMTPAIDSNGILYFGGMGYDGYFYAVGTQKIPENGIFSIILLPLTLLAIFIAVRIRKKRRNATFL